MLKEHDTEYVFTSSELHVLSVLKSQVLSDIRYSRYFDINHMSLKEHVYFSLLKLKDS